MLGHCGRATLGLVVKLLNLLMGLGVAGTFLRLGLGCGVVRDSGGAVRDEHFRADRIMLLVCLA